MYGFYDVALGLSCRATCKELYKDFDKLIEKVDPNRMTGEELNKVYNITRDYSALVAKAAGFKSVDEYTESCDLMKKLRNIRVPTFYLNAMDDPFFGPHCIPM